MRPILTLLLLVWVTNAVHADEAKPLPPIKPIPRLLPPKGVDIGQEERDKLEARLADLRALLRRAELDADLRPDVEIYTKAVRWALDFDEFYDAKKDIAKAHAALDSAQKRFDELRGGKHPWTTQRGLLARGYTSDIDGSVQPYGLHIPANLDLSKPVPLLVWLHGRGDKETDLHFIATREKNKGEFAPDWCITLHPYGRGTIGFKFAGEIDVLDAIESVKKRYKIDDDRIALAGFSMGGAGAWHIGAHYADRFCVVHAGAGFVETAKYNRLTPDKYPAWYEQKLWGWYDVPCYTRNLFNVPVIAYSGENDKQIQAAREMEAAFKAEGRELNHIIGPGVEHKYEPKAKEEILKQIKAAVDKGRDKWLSEIFIQGRMPRYGHFSWVSVTGIHEPWMEFRLNAKRVTESSLQVTTKNVTEFALRNPWQKVPAGLSQVEVSVDGQKLIIPVGKPDGIGGGDGVVLLKLRGDKWTASEGWDGKTITKSAYMSGSIDDAFMRRFLVVTPSKQNTNPTIQRWMDFEIEHLRSRWRALFRGDLPMKHDADVTEEDRHSRALVLWGDPQTNTEIARALDVKESPSSFLRWTSEKVVIGTNEFDARTHIPVAIFSRPLRGENYIVLNSGPTFREGHDRTNSQQTPKLPDWAIIGLDKDPDAFAPGEIKAAGFFDENWKVKKEEGR